MFVDSDRSSFFGPQNWLCDLSRMNEKAQELNYSSSTLSEELKIAKNGAIWKGFWSFGIVDLVVLESECRGD